MGVLCYSCGDMLCDIPDAPGHISWCADCLEKNQTQRVYLTNTKKILYAERKLKVHE